MNDALGAPQAVLLLGGSSEIGLAIVRALAEPGRLDRVVLAVRDVSAESDLRAQLPGIPTDAIEVRAFDAREVDSHRGFVDAVFDAGDIDVVIVAFGLLGDQEAIDAGDDGQAVALAETNYVGAVSAGLAVARRLRAQGHGSLVALSSVAGERARRSNFVYGSTKAGLDVFYQGLSDSLEGSGANVLVVRPGFVHTRMTEGMDPAPLATTPEAVAKAVIGGLTTGKHTVWAPAPMRYVMSALRHVPRPVFRKLPI